MRNGLPRSRDPGWRTVLTVLLCAALASAASARSVSRILGPSPGPGLLLSTPWAVAADDCGGLYITGINNDVVIYRDATLQFTAVLTEVGDGVVPMRMPEGVETDAACRAVVGARASSAVFRVSPAGVVERLLDENGDGVHPLRQVGGVATAADGSVYASGIESNNVFHVAPGGAVTQIIDASGDGLQPLAGATAVETDVFGNAYVAGVDSNNVFRISPGGVITRILDAGGDGVTPLSRPVDIAAGPSGEVFVTSRDTNSVFRIAAGGAVSVVLDGSGDGVHPLDDPVVVKADALGNAYVTGHGTSNLFRVAANGTITQLIDATGDGVVPYRSPVGATVAPDGRVYTAGINSNNVFEIQPNGQVLLTALGGSLNDPGHLDIDIHGNLNVSMFLANTVQRIAADGTITTLIGPGGDGAHPLTLPAGIDSDSSGNVFVAGAFSENVFRVHPNGATFQILDRGGDGVNELLTPTLLASDGSGNVYVLGARDGTVFRVRASGHVSTIFRQGTPGTPPLEGISALAADGAGNVFLAGAATHNVVRIGVDGVAAEVASAADGLGAPAALAVGPGNDLFVAGAASSNVLRIPAAGAVAPVIGPAGDGVTPLDRPRALAVDERGNVFVAAEGGPFVFRITPAGRISVVADAGGDGANPLLAPGGLAANRGRTFVADASVNGVFASLPEIGVALDAAESFLEAGAGLQVNLGVSNETPANQQEVLRLELTLPGGQKLPLLGGVPAALPAGTSNTVPLPLSLPANAPPGTYALSAYTLRPPGSTTDVHTLSFELVTQATRGPVFVDATAAAGLAFAQEPQRGHPNCLMAHDPIMPGPGFECMQESMAGSAAAGDFDDDGFPDLYVTRVYESDLLFRNRGDGTFEDVTDAAGLGGVRQTNGAAWVDIDNDHDLDLYVLTHGENRNYLFVNQGGGVFTEEAAARGAALDTGYPHWGMSIATGDVDNDGWVDIYATDWIADFLFPETGRSHARLLRNLGNGQFEDVTDAAGANIDGWPASPYYMQLSGALAFAAAFVDLDGDGWQDLGITGEMGSSRLLWNDGDGTFTDGTDAAGLATSASEMGSTFGDLDGDGDLEWLITAISCEAPYTRENNDCSGNRAYFYEGGRAFSDRTDALGIRTGHWGWGAALFDYDNDTDLDFVHTNGMDVLPPAVNEDNYVLDPMRFFRNDGGTFVARENLVGLTDREDGKGLLVFDYDRDGDQDIFLVNTGGPPRLYRNDGGNVSDSLRIEVEGTTSNASGLGARIEVQVVPGGPVQTHHVGVATHYQAQSEHAVHAGLGVGPNPVHRVTVTWPVSGAVQEFSDVTRNSTLHVVEP